MSEGQELAWLVDRYRDGDLDARARAGLAARLAADPVFAAAFLAEVRSQGRLAGLFHGDGESLWRQVDDALAIGASSTLAERVLARIPAARRPWLGWSLAAGVLVALLLGLAIGTYHPAPHVTVAMEDDRLAGNTSAQAGAGARLACDLDQRARLDFADGTRVELGSGGAVRLDGLDHGGTHLTLESGPLSAVVAKQPAGVHFVVDTRDARLTVIGTRFTAVHLPWGTRVEVDEGRVLTRRSRDGAEVYVDAGSAVLVRPDAPFAPQALRPALPPGAQAFVPVADSIVVGGRYSGSNRGTYKSHILTSPAAAPDEQRMFYLAFDLAGLRGPVVRAGLRLHLDKLRHPGMRLEVALVDRSWQETTITWATCPPAGAVVAWWTPGPDDAPIDLTAAVAAAAGGRLSLRIRAVDGTPADALVGFNTREAAPGRQPLLVVEGAPEP
jgi:ferric-dicitrate binding protein FerR (iron transport regulator)